MQTLKAANGLYIYKMEWLGDDLYASFYYKVVDAEGEVHVEPHLQDAKVNSRKQTLQIFAAFRDHMPVNVAYHDESEEIVYVELSHGNE